MLIDDLIPTDKLSLSINFRARYEYLSQRFRIGQVGDDQGVVLRTLVHGRVKPFDWITLGAELQDSRAYLTDDAVLTTTVVNALELLQAYVDVRDDDVFDGSLHATGGRITMDVGSRRFVARNRYRNTINGFTGLDASWTSHARDQTMLRAFWTLPVHRRPRTSEQARLHANDIQFDREDLEVQFWGLFGSTRLPERYAVELFVFGLHEKDTLDRPTANRQIYTMGSRGFRKKTKGDFDFVLEFALQWGQSRSSRSPTNTRDLDHFAHFEHLEAGYTFDRAWKPRISLQYDYASGDSDPSDGKNGRFHTLFGARRFDFGPTGIYGPFARSNINTPGLRLQLSPAKNVTGFLSYRLFWLAEKRDRWTTTGVVDPTGQSGSFIGQQIEFRLRWRPLPRNLLIEAGYAHLFDGEFIKNAPNSPAQGDSDYVYTQVVFHF